jgi:hypothetical protein
MSEDAEGFRLGGVDGNPGVAAEGARFSALGVLAIRRPRVNAEKNLQAMSISKSFIRRFDAGRRASSSKGIKRCGLWCS